MFEISILNVRQEYSKTMISYFNPDYRVFINYVEK